MISPIRHYFIPGVRILELGGGSGYQASILASWNCKVVSIDLPTKSSLRRNYFPVFSYDGENIPFSNASFDILFSSNVLEHIRDLPTLFSEMHRVLKPNGLALHILPSPIWRFWTSITHYPYLIKKLFGRFYNRVDSSAAIPIAPLNKHNLADKINKALIAGPHGEYPTALSEMYYFSKRRWLHVFTQNKFDVFDIKNNRLFYTGYSLFPWLPLRARKHIARIMGSTCHIFIMRPKPN